jgi:nocturnin
VDDSFPPHRSFEQILSAQRGGQFPTSYHLRFLQFNVLADGLSGLRADLGDFSRLTAHELQWDRRQWKLLFEILQYDPDVVTLQECDHFHDVFLPLLRQAGYDGVFAAKPRSACLEVSTRSDGCAVFWKTSKVDVHSVRTLVYDNQATPSTDCNSCSDSKQLLLLPQNQVALLVRCSLRGGHALTDSPTILVATTHLKAVKTDSGERLRLSQIKQLLQTIESETHSAQAVNAVIIAGDLNSSPTNTVYPFLKAHPLGLRSVLNDDFMETRRGDLHILID